MLPTNIREHNRMLLEKELFFINNKDNINKEKYFYTEIESLAGKLISISLEDKNKINNIYLNNGLKDSINYLLSLYDDYIVTFISIKLEKRSFKEISEIISIREIIKSKIEYDIMTNFKVIEKVILSLDSMIVNNI